jgi:hypothetical protein
MGEENAPRTSDLADRPRDEERPAAEDEPQSRDDARGVADEEQSAESVARAEEREGRSERPDAAAAATAEAEAATPLLSSEESSEFEERWRDIQAGFVDQPRQAVEQADALVADLMERLAASFSETREKLEAQWGKDDDASTEDQRIAFTRYRSFFRRLLSS